MPADCYTQGISYQHQHIWLTCGQYRQSRIYRLSSTDGTIEKMATFPRHWFAEGNAIVEDRIVQLTWKNGIIAEINPSQLTIEKQHHINGEGWGIAFHKKHGLVMSNGSSQLSFLDPYTLLPTQQLMVTDRGQSIGKLNELEWVGDKLWANIWQHPLIAIIDPSNGKVEQWLDLTDLVDTAQAKGGEVLNGIVYLSEQGQVLITGKNWLHLYAVDFDLSHPHIDK